MPREEIKGYKHLAWGGLWQVFTIIKERFVLSVQSRTDVSSVGFMWDQGHALRQKLMLQVLIAVLLWFTDVSLTHMSCDVWFTISRTSFTNAKRTEWQWLTNDSFIIQSVKQLNLYKVAGCLFYWLIIMVKDICNALKMYSNPLVNQHKGVCNYNKGKNVCFLQTEIKTRMVFISFQYLWVNHL